MKCLVVYNFGSLEKGLYKETCSIVESNETLDTIQKELYNLGDYSYEIMDKVFGSNFSFFNEKIIGDPKFGSRIVSLTEEQVELIIKLYDEKKFTNEMKLKEQKIKEEKLQEEHRIFTEEYKKEFKKLEENFIPKKFTILVDGKKKNIEFLGLENKYTYIVSYNNEPKQKAHLCFKDTVHYPMLKLESPNIYIKINNQKAIDYLWKSLDYDRVSYLYAFTTEFKNNYIE